MSGRRRGPSQNYVLDAMVSWIDRCRVRAGDRLAIERLRREAEEAEELIDLPHRRAPR